MKVSECAFDRVKEAFEKVAKDEARKLPALQQFHFGRLRMVGLWRIKADELVVRDLWRKVRLEATRQALGGAKMRKFLPGQGLQSACGTSGPLWKSDRCAEVAGEPTRIWRRPHTEHRDEPRRGSRKGLTNGLRDFINIDNPRALEVRHVSEGLRTFRVRRPKGSEGCPEVTVGDASSRRSGYVEVLHQYRPHSRGEVKSSPSGYRLARIRRCTKASKEKTGERCMMLAMK